MPHSSINEGSRIHSLMNDLAGNVCRGGPTAQAAQRRRRDDALGSAAHAEQRVHAAVGLAGGDGGRDVSVRDELDAESCTTNLFSST